MPKQDQDEQGGPSESKFFTNPVILVLISAVVGLLSGIASTFISDSVQRDQYWRDKRLQVYSEFYAAVEATADTHQILILKRCVDLEANQFRARDVADFERIKRRLDQELISTREEFALVPVLARDPVLTNSRALMNAVSDVSDQYNGLILDFRNRGGATTPLRVTRLRDAIEALSTEKRQEFTSSVRAELNIE